MKFYGELLVYFLLLLNVCRVFVLKRVKQDSMIIIPPVCMVLAGLLIYAYGISETGLQVMAMSVLVFIVNLHATLRSIQKLFLDHFSIAMIAGCAICAICIIVSVVFLFINRPVEYDKDQLEITETEIYYEGNFRSGFSEPETFSKRTAIFKEYKSRILSSNPKNVIIFFADKRGDSDAYKPYLQLLAKEGFLICTCDFYTDDEDWGLKYNDIKALRRFELQNRCKKDPDFIKNNKSLHDYNLSQEYLAMMRFARERYGTACKFFYVGDGMTADLVKDKATANPSKVTGYFLLDSIPEYKTAGYGCLELTNPYLGKKFGVKRDPDGFITKYLVMKTKNYIIETWGNQ